MILQIMIKLRKWQANRSLKKAIKEAEYLAYMSGRTYYILNFDGYLGIYNHSGLKKLIEKKFFQNKITVETLKNRAVYTTARQFERNKQKQVKK